MDRFRRGFPAYAAQAFILTLALAAICALAGLKQPFSLVSLILYLFPLLVFSSFHGFTGTLAALAGIPAALLLVVPRMMTGLFGAPDALPPGPEAGAAAGTALVFAAVLAALHHRNADIVTALKERLKELSQGELRYRRSVDAMRKVYGELEQRISRNKENISLLYNLLRDMDSLELKEVVEALSKGVRLFAHARKFNLRVFSPGTRTLSCLYHWGYGEDPPPAEIHEHGSIEGWVCRNSAMFSVRLVLDNPLLERMDRRDVVMAFPVRAGNRIWGVLSVTEMEFYKYNLHTEQLLSILLNLAEPAITRSLDYRRTLGTGAPDGSAGLPSFARLGRVLAQLLDRMSGRTEDVTDGGGSVFSLAVIEIANIGTLLADPDDPRQRASVTREVGALVRNASGTRSRQFQYRTDLQLALVLDGMDRDGSAMLCLDILSALNEHYWDFGGRGRDIEVYVGYVTCSGGCSGTDELFAGVDRMIDSQRRRGDESL